MESDRCEYGAWNRRMLMGMIGSLLAAAAIALPLTVGALSGVRDALEQTAAKLERNTEAHLAAMRAQIEASRLRIEDNRADLARLESGVAVELRNIHLSLERIEKRLEAARAPQ